MKQLFGNQLSEKTQEAAKRRYVHRFTGDYTPDWVNRALRSGTQYPLQFRSDGEWLDNTKFWVNNDGTLAWRRGFTDCQSTPTWPNGNILINLHGTTEQVLNLSNSTV